MAGKVAAVEGHGTPEKHVISVHGHGRFLGELNLLTGEVSFSTAVVVGAGEVLAVPADRLKELVARDPAIGDLVLRAYLLRRSILIGLGAGLRIIGSRYSPDTRRVRDFAARNRLPARWLDLETDPAAEELLAQLGVSPQDTPIVIVAGRLLRNPRNTELAAAIGLPAPSASLASCDLLVVGSGPAGMSAAVYGASEGLRVIVLDGTATGGQAGTTRRGREGKRGRKRGEGGGKREMIEKVSVYYAASQAEAQLCRGDPVVIVGGGNSAGQAAVFLARHAAQVTLVVREQDLGEYMSRYLIDQVLRIPNVRVMLNTEVRELFGDEALEAIAVEDRRTGERQVLAARALFVFIGMAPCTSWLGDMVDVDDYGFIRTGNDAFSDAGGPAGAENGWQRSMLETSQPGIFAVGDVRAGSAKRVAAAVGEGAMAIRLAFERMRPT